MYVSHKLSKKSIDNHESWRQYVFCINLRNMIGSISDNDLNN